MPMNDQNSQQLIRILEEIRNNQRTQLERQAEDFNDKRLPVLSALGVA